MDKSEQFFQALAPTIIDRCVLCGAQGAIAVLGRVKNAEFLVSVLCTMCNRTDEWASEYLISVHAMIVPYV